MNVNLDGWTGALEALRAAFQPLLDYMIEIGPQLERLDHRHLMRRKIRRMVQR